ncbi:MAG: peptide chain release factor N(5)-glutamine methyltransferase [Acidobacteriota bacterium]
MGIDLGSLVADAKGRLRAAPFAPPAREALLLAGYVLGLSEAQVLAFPERLVPPDDATRFARLLERRLAGEPFAYLTGEKEFFGRPFAVDRRVLIPRPETEHLVSTALELTLPNRPRILDVGTGSGCLAVTLALELPKAQVVATDLSLSALAVAHRNIVRHRVSARVTTLAADRFSALDPATFDLIVSNPPYIGRQDEHLLSSEILDHEPHSALFSTRRGRAMVEDLIEGAVGMNPGTSLLLEIGHDQIVMIRRHAAAWNWNLVATIPDYAGIPRVVRLDRP